MTTWYILPEIDKICLTCALPYCVDIHHRDCPQYDIRSATRPERSKVKRKKPLQNRILRLLTHEPLTIHELKERTGAKEGPLSGALYRMYKKGQLTREKIVYHKITSPNHRKVFLYRRAT